MDLERYEEIQRGDRVAASEAEEAALALEWALGEAERARTDLATFLSFVVRAEKTNAPIVPAAHQRLILDFVAAHRQCVLRLPIETSKTTIAATIALHWLGENPRSRGAIVSATQTQAMKPLGMIADYVETSDELRLVFPGLRRSQRKTESWAQSEITVDRPPGIRDASVVAVGVNGAIDGARLDWMIVDDVLNAENTATKESCLKVASWLLTSALPRLDKQSGRCIVCNTPWSPLDVTYFLERPEPEGPGWPSLTMDVEGNIFLRNCDDFDSPEIRPAARRAGDVCRLAAHDPDPEETTPIWPLKYDRARIDELRRTNLPHHFNMLYMCVCRDDETARCKASWVEQCKESGQGLGVAYPATYVGGNPTFTGVDLAVGKGKRNDLTALFTFEQLADGKRKVLDIDVGQWDAPTIVDKVIAKATAYKSLVRVESNAAQQYLVQFIRQKNKSVPVKAHNTGLNKVDPRFGIEGLFLEFQNNAWIIPCDAVGRVHRNTQRWIEDCTSYDPTKHTGDTLIAAWLAREMARDIGCVAGKPYQSATASLKGLAGRLLAR